MSEEATPTIQTNSWAFAEARKLIDHIDRKKKSDPVVFQTGFGPSGLPHIGTFAEVTRTTFVRHAFEELTAKSTQLIAFVDDMDGLRKVPGNLPNVEMMENNLGKPLCHIPDPFGTAASFSDHMTLKLIEFLDRYQLEHDARSSRDQYFGGVFNDVLAKAIERVEEIKEVILPTMREVNRKEWSPFMPICEQCGRNLTTVVESYDVPNREVEYTCHGGLQYSLSGCGYHGKRSILNGGVKVGWRVDWALRWTAFDVDYEMYGKDLIESYDVSSKICRILGGTPPHGYFYEMFLDENGRKISKSVGEGLTIDEWLRYAPLGSLSYYIYNNPRKAKRLYFDVIPRHVDEYLDRLKNYPGLSTQVDRYNSPVWYIHDPWTDEFRWDAEVNFSLIQNLVSALGTDDEDMILDYVNHYDEKAKEFPAILLPMVQGCIRYYQDHVLPYKQFYTPSAEEKNLIRALESRLSDLPNDSEAEHIQTEIFTVARDNNIPPRDFFRSLYYILLGQESGPRLGAFFKLLGLEESQLRLRKAIA